ncbi:hypothetical protein E2K98_17880 [Bacillus salipaludis]|uniref:Uncharacterized protein n=1 Tax=Bacillus salipaludis TaxID=2547811 RepID=A0A4R5VQ83_9BACI|nr:hypothetical protein [Bacillus salipaludis]TDK59794.1 hypothetical protein E2K98_17880 [Bacillus salipaludis]
MIGLIIAIIGFNLIAFKTNKILTANLIAHIWVFTVALQSSFDIIIEFKFHAYWYFGKEVDWSGLIPHLFLLPPVNMIFLNRFPYTANLLKKAVYIFFFVIAILLYELVTLLPEPWGYFHYGWWTLWHAAILDPFLLLILLGYYRWVRHLEKKALGKPK